MKELKEGKYQKDGLLYKAKIDKNVIYSPTSGYIPHGLGRLVYSGIQGAYIIEGTFFEGKVSGYCRWIWHDGMYYCGFMKGFNCHGQGKKILGNS